MQTLIRITAIIFIGLTASCNNDKPTAEGLKIEHRILDRANLLTEDQEDSVFGLIRNLEEEIGSQIAILTIETLGEQKLEEFSLKMAGTLGLGRKTHNDGLLITIVYMDRLVRIEVGTGLENIIKDEIAAGIIRDDMAPKFRVDKYGEGVYLAVSRISKLIADNRQMVGTDPI